MLGMLAIALFKSSSFIINIFYILLYFRLFYAYLKWVACKVRLVSGEYFQTTMMVMATFMIILQVIVLFIGEEPFQNDFPIWVLIVCLVPSILLWYFFDVFGYIRYRRARILNRQ